MERRGGTGQNRKEAGFLLVKIVFFAICIILTLLAGFKDDYEKGKSRRNAPEALVKAEDRVSV